MSAQKTEKTTTYNVYRVTLWQEDSPDHEAIALVPEQNTNQGAGRFYHVTGSPGLGMDYNPRKHIGSVLLARSSPQLSSSSSQWHSLRALKLLRRNILLLMIPGS